MDNQLMMPSQALNRAFDLPDAKVELVPSEQVAHSLHGFTVGNVGLLLPAETVSELFYDLAYCQLPNTAGVLVGLANVRGDIIPLIDLNELFGISAGDKVHWHFLIIGAGEDAVGFRVEGLPTRVTLSARNKLKTMPPLPELLRPYVRGCYQLDGIWLDWDVFGCFANLTEQI
jgi:twitching motility protein PilI